MIFAARETTQPPVQPVAAQRSGSHLWRNIAIIFVVILLFFLLPVVPYTFSSYSFLGSSYRATGYVSPSFVAFHCGVVVDVYVQSTYVGINTSSSTQNPGWVCNGSS
jgi:hypothetical protein